MELELVEEEQDLRRDDGDVCHRTTSYVGVHDDDDDPCCLIHICNSHTTTAPCKVSSKIPQAVYVRSRVNSLLVYSHGRTHGQPKTECLRDRSNCRNQCVKRRKLYDDLPI